MEVNVVAYDPAWPGLFYAESELVRRTLGSVAKEVHHIGSTSVPGLAAKPIIDILMEVQSLEELDKYNERMERIGYFAKGELGIPGRRYFPKGGDQRTHQIHAFARGNLGLARHLAFRDYLRAHPEVAREYAELKIAVARECKGDLGRYCDGKDDYVKRIEAVAVLELAAKRS